MARKWISSVLIHRSFQKMDAKIAQPLKEANKKIPHVVLIDVATNKFCLKMVHARLVQVANFQTTNREYARLSGRTQQDLLPQLFQLNPQDHHNTNHQLIKTDLL